MAKTKDEDFETPRPKKSKPKQNFAYTDDNDEEDEEDPGHMEIHKFLRTTKAPEKRKPAARKNEGGADFQRLVETQQVELRKFFRDKAREVQEQDARFREGYTSVLQDSLANNDIANIRLMGQSPSKSKSHPLFIQATAVLTSAKGLLEYYNSLAERIASADGKLTQREGDNDFTNLEKLIANRSIWLDKQVQRRLVEGKGTYCKDKLESLCPAEQTLWSRFGMDTAEVITAEGKLEGMHAVHEAWIKTAKHVKRGVNRLLKHLPDEE